MIVSIIAALALQAAAPVQSDAKAPPAKTAQADKAKTDDKNDPNKKVCHRQTPVGSTIEQRICKTKDEWDKEADTARNTADGVLNAGGLNHF
jgi:hypothetical protein